LIRKEHVMLLLWSFQGAREPVPAGTPPAEGRSLKTQQRERPEGRVEVDVVPGEPERPDGSRPSTDSDAYRSVELRYSLERR